MRRGKAAAVLGISSVEECAGLDKLTRTQERVLIDCFAALDEGATAEDCFARYPQRAESLHGYLAMRDQLLALKATTPSPTAFTSGREALLAGVIRPLANGHPGSMEAQGRQARGLFWRPAARVVLAGALLFALAGCALGVSATAGGDLNRALPDLPTIDLPPPRPIYPFPQYNAAPPIALPTQEAAPSDTGPTDGAPSSAPDNSQGGAIDDGQQPLPTKTDDPSQGWLPPQSAHETDPPADVVTPQPPDADSSTQPDGPPGDAQPPATTAPGDDEKHNGGGSHEATDSNDQSTSPDSGATDAPNSPGKGANSD